MNTDIIEGKWEQLKGSVQEKWGELTDDDIAEVKGNSNILVGKIQERYGKSKEEVEQELDAWQSQAAA